MSQKDYEGFRQFYQLFPFDDHHRVHLPAAVIAASMGVKMEDALKVLDPPPNESGWSQAELNSFKSHGITPPMRER